MACPPVAQIFGESGVTAGGKGEVVGSHCVRFNVFLRVRALPEGLAACLPTSERCASDMALRRSGGFPFEVRFRLDATAASCQLPAPWGLRAVRDAYDGPVGDPERGLQTTVVLWLSKRTTGAPSSARKGTILRVHPEAGFRVHLRLARSQGEPGCRSRVRTEARQAAIWARRHCACETVRGVGGAPAYSVLRYWMKPGLSAILS